MASPPIDSTNPSKRKSSSLATDHGGGLKEKAEAVSIISNVRYQMQLGKKIKGNRRSVVFDAIYLLHPLHTPLADEMWEFFQKSHRKPNQVMYSKMMKIYARKGDVIQLRKAAQLVDQWKHQFMSDPDSLLVNGTHFEAKSPVIINQMMRAISLWCTGNVANISAVLDHDSVHSALLHYLHILIDLDLSPDRHTNVILWNWIECGDLITPSMCVQMVQEAKSAKMIDWILHQLLFHLIEKHSFPRFDEEHNRIITSRLWQLDDVGSNDVSDRLFMICRQKIHYLCYNGFRPQWQCA